MERQEQELEDLKSDIRELSEEQNQTTQSLALQERRVEDYYSRYNEQKLEKIRLEAAIDWYKDREAVWQSHAQLVDGKLNDQTKKMDSQEQEIGHLRASLYNGWDDHAPVTVPAIPSQSTNVTTSSGSAPQHSYYTQSTLGYDPERSYEKEDTIPPRSDSALAWCGDSDIGVGITCRMSFLFYANQ